MFMAIDSRYEAPQWVNAVITCVVPLDIPIDATAEDKLEAAIERWEKTGLFDDFVCTVNTEDVVSL
jgi:hypothetical protein